MSRELAEGIRKYLQLTKSEVNTEDDVVQKISDRILLLFLDNQNYTYEEGFLKMTISYEYNLGFIYIHKPGNALSTLTEIKCSEADLIKSLDLITKYENFSVEKSESITHLGKKPKYIVKTKIDS